jgi:hypothetical protein
MKALLLTAMLLGTSFANADVNASLKTLENLIKNNVPEKSKGPLLEAYDNLVNELNNLQCATDESTNQQNRSDCQVAKDYTGFYVQLGNVVVSQYYRKSAITSATDLKALMQDGICTRGSIAADCEVAQDSNGFYVKRGGVMMSQYHRSRAITSARDLSDLKNAGLCN